MDRGLDGSKRIRESRYVTLALVATACVLLVAVFVVGISDNVPGVLLSYAATVALVGVFVHTWRKTKYFLLLMAVSLVGFPVFVFLHNVFYAMAELTEGIFALRQLLEFFHAAFFIIAILVCPAGILVGVAGSVITLVGGLSKRLRPPEATERAQDKKGV